MFSLTPVGFQICLSVEADVEVFIQLIRYVRVVWTQGFLYVGEFPAEGGRPS